MYVSRYEVLQKQIPNSATARRSKNPIGFSRWVRQTDIRQVRTHYQYITFFTHPLACLDTILYVQPKLVFTNPSALHPTLDILQTHRKRLIKKLQNFGLYDDYEQNRVFLLRFYNLVDRLEKIFACEGFATHIENKNDLTMTYNFYIMENKMSPIVLPNSTSVLNFSVVKDRLDITGRANKLKVNKHYTLQRNHFLYLQLYLDLCKAYKLTPFRYLCHPNYLNFIVQNFTNGNIEYRIVKKLKAKDNIENTNTAADFNVLITDYLTKKKKEIPVSIRLKLDIDKIKEHISRYNAPNKDSFVLQLKVGNSRWYEYSMQEIGFECDSFDTILYRHLLENFNS